MQRINDLLFNIKGANQNDIYYNTNHSSIVAEIKREMGS